MNAQLTLLLASAAIVLVLGSVHLVYTFFGPRLLPRDPKLVAAMKEVHLVLTKETTVWRAWIGFNATHSMAAISFGLIYGYLGAVEPEVLYGSVYLVAVGFLFLAALVALARRYFFNIPFVGAGVALCCYAASVAVAWT